MVANQKTLGSGGPLFPTGNVSVRDGQRQLHFLGLLARAEFIHNQLFLSAGNGQAAQKWRNWFVHCFMAGPATLPHKVGREFVQSCSRKHGRELGAGKNRAVVGRYYAMDRR